MLKEYKKKLLEKYYFNNKQMFQVCSIEVMDGIHDTYLSIYTVKDGYIADYLFDIRNYDAFWDLNHTLDDKMYSKFDEVGASCAMYYDIKQNLFTIPKFGNLTKEEILKCTKYLMRNYFDSYCIWNYRWVEPNAETFSRTKPNRIARFFNNMLRKT